MIDEERSVLRIGFLRHYAIVITALMVERMGQHEPDAGRTDIPGNRGVKTYGSSAPRCWYRYGY